MVNLVSVSFIRSLGLEPCQKHQHIAPRLKGVRETHPKTYGFFHLRITLIDRFNRSFDCICPFLAVDRDTRDSQVLLGCPALKDFSIIIRNDEDSWEFKRIPKVKKISVAQFERELSEAKATAFQVRIKFKPYEEEEEEPWDSDARADEVIDLLKVPKRLRIRYRDFFSAAKAARPVSYYLKVNHAIKLRPSSKPPWIRTYNMSPAELKALDDYINDTLAKGWIRESKSPAGIPVLFIPRKSGELRLCIDYRGLNALTVKNRYPLPLINKLLDRLNSSVVFSKIDLRNTYYRIRIREGNE